MSETRPPLGLKPRQLVEEDRLEQICQAVVRYMEASKPIPEEWIEELAPLFLRALGRWRDELEAARETVFNNPAYDATKGDSRDWKALAREAAQVLRDTPRSSYAGLAWINRATDICKKIESASPATMPYHPNGAGFKTDKGNVGMWVGWGNGEAVVYLSDEWIPGLEFKLATIAPEEAAAFLSSGGTPPKKLVAAAETPAPAPNAAEMKNLAELILAAMENKSRPSLTPATPAPAPLRDMEPLARQIEIVPFHANCSPSYEHGFRDMRTAACKLVRHTAVAESTELTKLREDHEFLKRCHSTQGSTIEAQQAELATLRAEVEAMRPVVDGVADFRKHTGPALVGGGPLSRLEQVHDTYLAAKSEGQAQPKNACPAK
jgi:hypothetical protein